MALKKSESVKKTIVSSALLFIAIASYCQVDHAGEIRYALTQYQQNALTEKIYVHTDKNYYLAGEILWFKIYDVDGTFHHPIDISKLAYIELLDSDNKPQLQGKIVLADGLGNGSFYLPVSINSGNYKLRAYTNWMKNFGPDFFFEKKILIVNSQKAIATEARLKELPPDIHFFPEGGNLVAGIGSRVAFKVVGPDGSGIGCSGYIVDDTGDTATRFRTFQFGMGSFDFTPLAGHFYRAFFEMPDGKKIRSDLPEIFPRGYVLRLSSAESDKIAVEVHSNMSTGGAVYLFVHTGQSVKFGKRLVLQNGEIRFLVGLNELGEGISHFTIFDDNGSPVCERLYFKTPTRKLEMKLNPDGTAYKTRDQIRLSIEVTDEQDKPAAADMSVSVFNLDSLQNIDGPDIASYFWLTSDLKGAIESPEYYLRPSADQAMAVDNLMLTQGWRRFDWSKVLSNAGRSPAFPPEYNGHIIVGKVVDARSGKEERNITAYVSIPSTSARVFASTSDSTGTVKFETKNIYGTHEIIAQTNSRDDSLARVDIANPFFEKYSDIKLQPFKVAENLRHMIEDQSISMQVQNIWSSDKLSAFVNSPADTNAFFGNPSKTYLLDKYTRFTTLEEVLREYVELTSVRLRKGEFHLQVADVRRSQFFDGEPLVLLDGVPMFDMNKFMAYDPLKIKRLDVLNERFLENVTSFDGILSFTTYKGNLPGFDLDPHAAVLDYEGLQVRREFYSPVYDTEQKRSSNFPDFRNVLCWSPDIRTDSSGKNKLNFYASDIPGKYAVIVEGLSPDGRMASKSVFIEVKD